MIKKYVQYRLLSFPLSVSQMRRSNSIKFTISRSKTNPQSRPSDNLDHFSTRKIHKSCLIMLTNFLQWRFTNIKLVSNWFICILFLSTDGEIPRDFQEVLPGQTQRSKTTVAAYTGALCSQSSIYCGLYECNSKFSFAIEYQT